MELNEIRNIVKNTSIDDLKKIISKEMLEAEYGSFHCTNQTFTGLYRARKHNHLEGNLSDGKLNRFLNEKEFWNPPEDKITWYGRCNDIGESMFYCSNEFEVAVAEVRPEVGKYVSVCTFENIDFGDTGGKLYGFRMKPIGIDYLSKIEGFNSCIPKDLDALQRSSQYRQMDDFLDELFHETVSDEENYRYKLSIAVTKIMLTNTINQHKVEKMMHGLMYSSIVRKFKGANILFKPQPVKNFFFLKTVQTFEVLECDPDHIGLRLLRFGRTELQRTHPSQPKMDMVWTEIENGEEYFFYN